MKKMNKTLSIVLAVFLAISVLVLWDVRRAYAADCIYSYKTVTVQCSSIATGVGVGNGATVGYDAGQSGFHCTFTSLDSLNANNPPNISNWDVHLASSPAAKFALANVILSGNTYAADVAPAAGPICASEDTTLSFTLAATPNSADACYSGASFVAYLGCPDAPPPDQPPVTPPVTPPDAPPPDIIDNIFPPSDQPTVAIYTAAGTIGAIALASLGSSATNLIFSGWWNIFNGLGAFFARRKKKKSGRVIEEGTGMPIAGAVVELIAARLSVDGKIAGQKTVAKTKTDNYGEYILSAAPGLYKLEVRKPPYFISDNASAQRGEYEPNQILKIKNYEEGLVAPTIVMTLSQGEMAKKTRSLNFLRLLERALSFLSYALMVFGTIIAVNNLARHYSAAAAAISLVYLLLWGFILYNSRRRKANSPWGEVYDSQNRKPLSLTLVRVMDRDSHKLIRTAVTDKDGKFSATVSRSNYRLLASKPGYVMKDGVRTDVDAAGQTAPKAKRTRFINQKLWMKRGFLPANSES